MITPLSYTRNQSRNPTHTHSHAHWDPGGGGIKSFPFPNGNSSPRNMRVVISSPPTQTITTGSTPHYPILDEGDVPIPDDDQRRESNGTVGPNNKTRDNDTGQIIKNQTNDDVVTNDDGNLLEQPTEEEEDSSDDAVHETSGTQWTPSERISLLVTCVGATSFDHGVAVMPRNTSLPVRDDNLSSYIVMGLRPFTKYTKEELNKAEYVTGMFPLRK